MSELCGFAVIIQVNRGVPGLERQTLCVGGGTDRLGLGMLTRGTGVARHRQVLGICKRTGIGIIDVGLLGEIDPEQQMAGLVGFEM